MPSLDSHGLSHMASAFSMDTESASNTSADERATRMMALRSWWVFGASR